MRNTGRLAATAALVLYATGCSPSSLAGHGLPGLGQTQFTVSVGSALPADLASGVSSVVTQTRAHSNQEFTARTSGSSDLEVGVVAGVQPDTATFKTIYTSYLIPVGHIYWVKDGIATPDLVSGPVVTTVRDRALAAQVLGAYAQGAPPPTAEADLAGSLLGPENQIGLIDFSELSNTFKVLHLNGAYFLDDPDHGGIAYSVVARPVSAAPTAAQVKALTDLAKLVQPAFPAPFSKANLLVMDQTGTTAITRALGLKINQSGQPGYAAQLIAPFFQGADLVHISDEVAFVNDCNPIASDTAFCAAPSYIANLKAIGVNMVELTGNHQNDYGADADAATIQTYKQQGWDYFGGGLNGSDAAKILYKDMKGTRLALLGYNYYDTVQNDAEIATDPGHAGANSWSPDKLKTDIATARAAGAQDIIVDFQYQECWAYVEGNTDCYAPISQPDQVGDFRSAIDDGADIVVGTQAHQPQTYEIYKGRSIFYGLGNLFFDQWEWTGTRQGVILTHYFYNGRYLTTKLTTTDYDTSLQVYVSTGHERLTLLNDLHNARSG